MKGKVRTRAIALLALGAIVGMMLVGTPASAHFSSSISHIWKHIKANADKRYDRPTVKSGETIRGTIGQQVISSATGEWGFNAQLPRAARAGLDDAHVEIAGTDGSATECPGTAQNPTAAPGFVCMYPYSTSGMTAGQGAIWGSGDGTKWGFQASINATSTGEVWWFANWAYRAPVASPRPIPRTAGCGTAGQAGC